MDRTEPRAPSDELGEDDAVNMDEPGLFAGVGQLFEDGRTYLAAELDYQGERVRLGVSRAKGIVLLLLAAGALLMLVMFALIIGLLLALTPLVTIWGALVLVCGGLLLGAAICFRAAVGRVTALVSALSGHDK